MSKTITTPEGKPGVYLLVYRVNKMPHPQADYLGSRIRFSYSAKVTHYEEKTIGLLVKERLTQAGVWTNHVEELKTYMELFMDSRNVLWELIDESRMD